MLRPKRKCPIGHRLYGRRGIAVAAVAAGIALHAAASDARAQGLLERSPNLAGGWIGVPGVLQFNFMHRFRVSDAPQRKVTNTPTFTLAAGLPRRMLAGVQYASNSRVAANYPNEWEIFGRVLPLAERAGAPLDLSVQAGYNVAAASVDGELALARAAGPVRLIAAGRMFGDGYHEGESRLAAAAGAAIRLTRHLAVGADIASLLDRRSDEELAWSAGVQLAIPYSPHTLSLHASNVSTTTLQGASRGGPDVLYGFEFTIPITLRRYVPPRPEPVAAVRLESPDSTATPAADTTSAPVAGGVQEPAKSTPERGERASPSPADRQRQGESTTPEEVIITINGLKFGDDRIEIDAGTTVVWKNDDPVAHTATAGDGTFDSGVIEPGGRWSHTFDRPGVYPYACTPHPFMKGEIVVRGGEK